MAHSLGLKVIIRQYDTEQQALTALADRRWIPCSLRWRTGMRSPRAWINPRRCLKRPTLVTSLKSLCRR